ncbi:MAG: dihydrodipicolinate synthase family protein [Verrucomicrobiales bacterium]|nr:dihydrodipicolinate synthase family protein [Verrucomicrobiales bacterium]
METTKPKWMRQLSSGLVIPALPLALTENGTWSEPHQRALLRYYIDAGAGGIAAGVHSTQFAIRDPKYGLFEPVLKLALEIIEQFADEGFVRIAGVCGETKQAVREARFAAGAGYHAGLLSMAAVNRCDEEKILRHVAAVSGEIPVVGFYLQPSVGGRVFPYSFWRRFCDIENVVAIKAAPFNRYQTWDVVRAVIESGRDDIEIYTGNDDNIIVDLLTPFSWQGQTRYITGGLLGQWGVWTKRAVEMLEEIKVARESGHISTDWLTKNAALTDANAAVFDSANGFHGCIPGILEILRRQGLVPSIHCLNPGEKLSPGQAAELDRVCRAYPEMTDDDFVSSQLNQWLEL